MRTAAAILCLGLAAPAAGQDAEGPGPVERGVESMLRGLMAEMAPAIDDLETTMTLLEGIVGRIEEYEAPRMLPNGDIVIRRRRAPPGPEIAPGDGEVEL